MQVRKFDTGAVRDADADSTRYDLVSPEGLRRVAETYAEGAVKYSDHNWRKGMPFSATANHAIKHIFQYLAGETDEDHLAHAAWGLFALMEFEKTHPELDDRYFKPKGGRPQLTEDIALAAGMMSRFDAEQRVGYATPDVSAATAPSVWPIWHPIEGCTDTDCDLHTHYDYDDEPVTPSFSEEGMTL